MKKLISLVLALTLCLSISSCNLTPDSDVSNKYDHDYKACALSLAADKISLKYDDYRQEGYREFLEKLDVFASKLTYEVYSDTDGSENFAISPISVYMALALATECANGETRDQILNAVGVSYDEVKSFTKYLYAYTNRSFYSNGKGSAVSAFEQLTNSIWVDNDTKLKDAAVSNLANNFNCDMFSVDFGSSEGNDAINSYIYDKTHGLIEGGVELSPETLFTIINTFYLKEIWNSYGDPLKLTDESYEFTNSSGSTLNINLLKGYYNDGKVYEGEGYKTFYTTTNHNFKIHFIVPQDGYTVDQVFTSDNIYNVNNITNYGTVDDENKLIHHTRVFFPEYEASFDDDIADTLSESFGISNMFTFGECDFTNVTDETVACEGVVHKCELKVNRKGIEGAAVTYIPTGGAVGPGEYEDVYHDFVIDRAFGFIITDSYGVVLFSGVVNNV